MEKSKCHMRDSEGRKLGGGGNDGSIWSEGEEMERLAPKFLND